MQDKNKLDDMAEKYKQEMMRLYSKKRAVPPPEPKAETVAPSEDKKPVADIVMEQKEDMEKLMNPPMPEIPMDYGRGAEETVMAPEKSKFPTAEQIMQAETAVQTIATITTDPRFEPAEDLPHNQGNYNYDAPEPLEDLEDYVEDIIPDIDYPDNDTDFEDLFDDDNYDDDNGNAPDMKGTGYLQVEITTGDGAVPVPKAAVIVTQEINGQSYLVTMKLTDRNGATEVIPLPAPLAEFSEAPDPTERPFSEYNVTVYKKGFYTVPEVTVPIFDTVKSIQPVALIPLAENELQGKERPDGGAMNG